MYMVLGRKVKNVISVFSTPVLLTSTVPVLTRIHATV